MIFAHHEIDKGFQVDTIYNPKQDGTETVILFKSQSVSHNKDIFYTDTNGYLMERREKDKRVGYVMTNEVPIARNYYPITSAIYLKNTDNGLRLTVNTDRAQGATSLKPGEIEIMIHRTTYSADLRGINEAYKDMNTLYA